MIKFIKLTESCRNSETKVLIIAMRDIKSVQLSNHGIDAHIMMQDKTFYFVKESVDSIWDMLK